MPTFESRVAFEVAKGVKAFLRLEVGLARGEAPAARLAEARARELEQAQRQIASKEQEIRELREELAANNARAGGISPENIVWIFGSGRSGSTWLMRMMAEMPQASFWNEPKVGNLFGKFYDEAQMGEHNARNFILGEPAREGWIPLIREFVMGSVHYRRPRSGPGTYLIVKEPNASVGAPLIMEALPESRMILLVRDPRDVVASFLDAMRKGSWLYERKDQGRSGQDSLSDTDPDAAVEQWARTYSKDISSAKQAFDAHGGRKALVRYEDMRAKPLIALRQIYSRLDIPFDESRLVESVEKHRWEGIPVEERGQGKKFRKATPGAWQEDLTAEQVKLVEKITAPLLTELYSYNPRQQTRKPMSTRTPSRR